MTWHQDQAVAVREKHSVDGFGPWSIKNDVHHVEPPLGVLEQITAIRIHLEDCTIQNGPLMVSPGTHRRGRIVGEEIHPIVQTHGEETCVLGAGSALLMKPLTLHRSSKTQAGRRRRVIHLDCTDASLPQPLHWKYQAAFTA